MWKISLPPGVVVSIFSCKLRKPMSRRSSSAIVSIRCRSRTSQPIQFPDYERVTWSQLVENLSQGWTLIERTTGGVDEDAIAVGRLQSIVLQVRVLVCSGHTGVAQQVRHRRQAIVSESFKVACSETLIVDTSSGRAFVLLRSPP